MPVTLDGRRRRADVRPRPCSTADDADDADPGALDAARRRASTRSPSTCSSTARSSPSHRTFVERLPSTDDADDPPLQHRRRRRTSPTPARSRPAADAGGRRASSTIAELGRPRSTGRSRCAPARRSSPAVGDDAALADACAPSLAGAEVLAAAGARARPVVGRRRRPGATVHRELRDGEDLLADGAARQPRRSARRWLVDPTDQRAGRRDAARPARLRPARARPGDATTSSTATSAATTTRRWRSTSTSTAAHAAGRRRRARRAAGSTRPTLDRRGDRATDGPCAIMAELRVDAPRARRRAAAQRRARRRRRRRRARPRGRSARSPRYVADDAGHRARAAVGDARATTDVMECPAGEPVTLPLPADAGTDLAERVAGIDAHARSTPTAPASMLVDDAQRRGVGRRARRAALHRARRRRGRRHGSPAIAAEVEAVHACGATPRAVHVHAHRPLVARCASTSRNNVRRGPRVVVRPSSPKLTFPERRRRPDARRQRVDRGRDPGRGAHQRHVGDRRRAAHAGGSLQRVQAVRAHGPRQRPDPVSARSSPAAPCSCCCRGGTATSARGAGVRRAMPSARSTTRSTSARPSSPDAAEADRRPTRRRDPARPPATRTDSVTAAEHVGIVTDSACDLPDDLVEQVGIEVVPLTIRFGDEEFVDREELTTAEFWARCAARRSCRRRPRRRPAASSRRTAASPTAGATGIVVVTLSGALSATMQSAELAARAVAADGIDVRVVDSRTVSLGLGHDRPRLRRAPRRPAPTLDAVDAARHASSSPAPACSARSTRSRTCARAAASATPRRCWPPRCRSSRSSRSRRRRRAARQAAHALQGAGLPRRQGRRRTGPHRAPRRAARRLRATSTSSSTMLRPLTDGEIVVGQIGPVIGAHAGRGTIGVAFHERTLSRPVSATRRHVTCRRLPASRARTTSVTGRNAGVDLSSHLRARRPPSGDQPDRARRALPAGATPRPGRHGRGVAGHRPARSTARSRSSG